MQHSWGRYADTLLLFPTAGLRVDLRLPLAAELPRRFAELGLGGSFAVVTACNPLGSPLDAAANRRLTAVFDHLVRERYPGAIRANGGSPDGSHEEAGWAIAAPLPELRRLAAEFLQHAIFWFDGERFVIVPVLAADPPLPLPPSRPHR